MAWRGAVLAVTGALGLLLARPPAPVRGLQERIFAPPPAPPGRKPRHRGDRHRRPGRDRGGLDPGGDGAACGAAGAGEAAGDRPRHADRGDCDGAPARDLATALQGQPAVLGLCFPTPRPGPAARPAGPDRAAAALAGAGAETPCPQLAGHDWAVMALMGGADATVRHVPVAAEVGRRALPGLAVAIAARAEGVLPLIGPAGLRLGAGPLRWRRAACALPPLPPRTGPPAPCPPPPCWPGRNCRPKTPWC
ncbi:hypothetical protein ACTTAM_11790 [Rhodobacter capsulatus]|uniref:hypothetical protein n=1 Tax=Rhodobacter capsulatus TaxID=1061 RepID=UPI00402A5BDD